MSEIKKPVKKKKKLLGTKNSNNRLTKAGKIKRALLAIQDTNDEPDVIVKKIEAILGGKNSNSPQYKYTPEAIKIMADGYQKWCTDSEDNIYMHHYFLNQYKIMPNRLKELKDRSPYLSEIIESMRILTIERIMRKALTPKTRVYREGETLVTVKDNAGGAIWWLSCNSPEATPIKDRKQIDAQKTSFFKQFENKYTVIDVEAVKARKKQAGYGLD